MVAAWFHGGVPNLGIGDRLLPPSVTGRTDGLGAIAAKHGLPGEHMRGDRVFLGSTVDIASLYAAMYPTREGGWIYECEPVGLIEPDPDYLGDPMESVQVPEAIVTRVIGPLPLGAVRNIRRLVAA